MAGLDGMVDRAAPGFDGPTTLACIVMFQRSSNYLLDVAVDK